jgi:hypothetical protein
MRQCHQARRPSLRSISPETVRRARARAVVNDPTDKEICERACAIYRSRHVQTDPIAHEPQVGQELRTQTSELLAEGRS